MSETPEHEGTQGRSSGRFYKVVGGLVVGLVAAVAVLPLLFGGSGDEQPKVVEIEPPLREQPATTESPDRSPPEAPAGSSSASGEGEKWWRTESGASSSQPKPTPPEEPASAGAEPAGDRARVPEPEPQADPEAPAEPEPESEPAQERGAAAEPTPEAEQETEAPSRASEAAPADGGEDATPPAAKTQEAPAGSWRVMVGSFREAENAQGLVNRLAEQGFRAEVQAAEVKGRTWNRVLVGGAESREEARKLVPRLKEAGYSDMLVMEVE